MTQTQIYCVVLPLDMAHLARVLAATMGKSRSGLMRDLLRDYLKAHDTPQPPQPPLPPPAPAQPAPAVTA